MSNSRNELVARKSVYDTKWNISVLSLYYLHAQSTCWSFGTDVDHTVGSNIASFAQPPYAGRRPRLPHDSARARILP
jgi:hypothetical protein